MATLLQVTKYYLQNLQKDFPFKSIDVFLHRLKWLPFAAEIEAKLIVNRQVNLLWNVNHPSS